MTAPTTRAPAYHDWLAERRLEMLEGTARRVGTHGHALYPLGSMYSLFVTYDGAWHYEDSNHELTRDEALALLAEAAKS